MVEAIEQRPSDVLLITLRQLRNEILKLTRTCPPDQRDRIAPGRWYADFFSDAIDFYSMADGFLTLSTRLLAGIERPEKVAELQAATESLLGGYLVLNQMLQNSPAKTRGRAADTEAILRTIGSQADDFLAALSAALIAAIPSTDWSVEGTDSEARGDHFRLIAYVNRVQARRTTEESLDQLVDRAVQAKSKEHAESARKLSEHFTEYGKREFRAANRLRFLSVLLGIATAAGLTVWTVVNLPDPTMAAEVAKLTAVLPLTLLAGYTARESSRHRVASRWAEHLAVQMETFPSYTVDLPDDQRRPIQTEFAYRIFGPPPTIRAAAEPSASNAGRDRWADFLAQLRRESSTDV